MSTLERKLGALGGDIHGPLEQLSVPMYVLDSRGTIVWLNPAAAAIINDGLAQCLVGAGRKPQVAYPLDQTLSRSHGLSRPCSRAACPIRGTPCRQ